MPAFDGGDDFVGIGGPYEGFGLGIGLCDESVDGGLEVGDKRKTPRLRRRLVSLAKKPSMALSQDAEVGVKWKVKRLCLASQARTRGWVWVVVVKNEVDIFSGGDLGFERIQEADE